MTNNDTFYRRLLPRVLRMTPRTKLFTMIVGRLRAMGYKVTKARYKGSVENFKLRKEDK